MREARRELDAGEALVKQGPDDAAGGVVKAADTGEALVERAGEHLHDAASVVEEDEADGVDGGDVETGAGNAEVVDAPPAREQAIAGEGAQAGAVEEAQPAGVGADQRRALVERRGAGDGVGGGGGPFRDGRAQQLRLDAAHGAGGLFAGKGRSAHGEDTLGGVELAEEAGRLARAPGD